MPAQRPLQRVRQRPQRRGRLQLLHPKLNQKLQPGLHPERHTLLVARLRRLDSSHLCKKPTVRTSISTPPWMHFARMKSRTCRPIWTTFRHPRLSLWKRRLRPLEDHSGGAAPYPALHHPARHCPMGRPNRQREHRRHAKQCCLSLIGLSQPLPEPMSRHPRCLE